MGWCTSSNCRASCKVDIIFHSPDATQITKSFEGLKLSPAQSTKLLGNLGAGLLTNLQQRFQAQQSPQGLPWKQSIRARVFGGKTLQDTGKLLQSMQFIVSGSRVEVGTNVEYARFLHDGATIKAKSAPYLVFRIGNRWSKKKEVVLPARPILGFSDQDTQTVISIINNFMVLR